MPDTLDQSAFPPGRLPAGAATPERVLLELPDGYRTVVYAHWPGADAPARLPVLYLHGIQSHPGWFVGAGADLARRGHPVFQVTRRGSGENALARGHADSAGQLLADVQAACRFVLDRSGAESLHLIGVSWGGKLLAAYAAGCHGCAVCSRARAHPHSARLPGSAAVAPPEANGAGRGIASLTLVAPGIAPKVDLCPLRKLAVGASALFRPRREFDIPLGDPDLFTDNEPMRRYIRDDRLSLRRATARFLLTSHTLDRMIRRAPGGSIGVRTKLILASRDRIIDNLATAQTVRRLTAGRCEVVELPGAHTLEFEPDPAPLYDAVAANLSPPA